MDLFSQLQTHETFTLPVKLDDEEKPTKKNHKNNVHMASRCFAIAAYSFAFINMLILVFSDGLYLFIPDVAPDPEYP